MTARRALPWLALATLLFVAGCASKTARSEELLAKDHKTLSDADLESYYFQLNDEIARVERSSSGTRVGIGIGSYPVHVGVSSGVPGRSTADELRDRRNEVREELKRRGLRP